MHKISLVVMELDGSFIYGDQQREIIDFCRMHNLKYGFITDRDQESCFFPVNILATYKPAFLAAASGTELYLAEKPGQYRPAGKYTARLAANWPGTQPLMDRLQTIPGCTGIEALSNFRVSAILTQPEYFTQLKMQLSVYNVRISLSWDRHLDILPAWGGKEGCLDFLALHFYCPRSCMLSCSSQESDIALLARTGYGVVVANSQTGLIRKLQHTGSVFYTESAGSRGVMEGLQHFRGTIKAAIGNEHYITHS